MGLKDTPFQCRLVKTNLQNVDIEWAANGLYLNMVMADATRDRRDRNILIDSLGKLVWMLWIIRK